MNAVDERHRRPEAGVLDLRGKRALEGPLASKGGEDRAESRSVREMHRESAPSSDP